MPASAEDRYSANYFLPGCKGFLVHESTQLSVSEMFMAIRCVGFIEGLGYGVEGTVVCRPNEVTTGQLVAVVVKYIEARPERMHEDFGKLAVEALTASWPCKR